jgi:hypothetical protein
MCLVYCQSVVLMMAVGFYIVGIRSESTLRYVMIRRIGNDHVTMEKQIGRRL